MKYEIANVLFVVNQCSKSHVQAVYSVAIANVNCLTGTGVVTQNHVIHRLERVFCRRSCETSLQLSHEWSSEMCTNFNFLTSTLCPCRP